MPRTCSICKSQRRSEIEAELIRGEAYRSIAKQYGCSAPAVLRHKNCHLPEKLTLAKRHQETLSAEGLLAEMAELKSRPRNGLDQAERAGKMAAFVAFAREHRQCLESYFEMADRIASKLRLGADGRGLAEIIAAARRRVGREQGQPCGAPRRDEGSGDVSIVARNRRITGEEHRGKRGGGTRGQKNDAGAESGSEKPGKRAALFHGLKKPAPTHTTTRMATQGAKNPRTGYRSRGRR